MFSPPFFKDFSRSDVAFAVAGRFHVFPLARAEEMQKRLAFSLLYRIKK
jgi:hypothetical protein